MGYANPNIKAGEFMDKAVREDESVYPPGGAWASVCAGSTSRSVQAPDHPELDQDQSPEPNLAPIPGRQIMLMDRPRPESPFGSLVMAIASSAYKKALGAASSVKKCWSK